VNTTAKAEVACGQGPEQTRKEVGVQWQEQEEEQQKAKELHEEAPQQQSLGDDEKQEQGQELEAEAMVVPCSVPALPHSTPAGSLSSGVPPTPARVEVLRQWQQWQRAHHQQRPFTGPTTKDKRPAADTDVRRAQLARMRSLLDELEGLPESLAEIRGRAAGARRPELRPPGQGVATTSIPSSNSRPPLRRASKKRIPS
jgi:hypothetical protein